MSDQEKLKEICLNYLKSKVEEEKIKIFQKRLINELIQIEVQEEAKYFLDLYYTGKKYDKNENNLIVPWLLNICEDFNILEETKYKMGDLPDIDIDYLPQVRDYLKNEWAVNEFGKEYVCNIGNYGTFGLKSTFIDMARVHGLDRGEILNITKQLKLKDDQGSPLSFEKALEEYPELKSYCDAHPEIAKAVKKLMHRNRSMGRHAGGLIISSERIDNFVPLAKNSKDETCASAWGEGLHGQDLSPVGLIKMDLLVVDVLNQLALASKMIKERHNLKNISAKGDEWDWSDLDYLNDPKCLEAASNGDLRGVFQFDGDGIRNLAKNARITSFDDLAALNALYRPSCLKMGMDKIFANRKNGGEEYEVHPLLLPILEKTYGVILYQEQVMQILNVAGSIPLRDCYQVLKAISKKKGSVFEKYKSIFLENGKINLGYNDDEIKNLYDLLVSFSEYGFNKTLTEDTIVNCENGFKQIKDFKVGDKVYCVNERGEQKLTNVLAIHDHGILDVVEITFNDGYKVKCTFDHKFLTKYGQLPLWKILKNNFEVLCSPIGEQNANQKRNKITMRISSRKLYKSYGTSKKMFKLQGSSMEISKRNKIYFSLRSRIHASSTNGRSSKVLQGLHENKKRKYKKKNGKIKFRQFISRKKGNFFCNSQKNICKKRCSACESRSIKKMERSKSRKICKMYRSSTKSSKKIKNGNLAKRFFKLAKQICSLWARQEVCRFGKQKNMDRSRWSFSFLGNKKEKFQKASQFFEYTKERQHAQGRGIKKKRYFINKNRFQMFQSCWRYERGLVENFTGHAPIKDTWHLLSRRILRIVPVGKRQCYDLEVSCSTHNFILPTGIITSNSHAYAYTYISARQLFLKCYFPIEFFCASLITEKTELKAKEIIVEANKKGIEVLPIKINISEVDYAIKEEKIIVGFSNIKGIGLEKAERIVQNKPYVDFFDFLQRYGTDANVIKPLIALNIFNEIEPTKTKEELYIFWLKYCAVEKNIKDKIKRNAVSFENLKEKADGFLPSKYYQTMPFDSPSMQKLISYLESLNEPDTYKKAISGLKRILKSMQRIESFKPEIITKDLIESFPEGKLQIDKEYSDSLSNMILCENKYYGFVWKTNLETSPDFSGGLTIENLKKSCEEDGILFSVVELEIEKVEKKKTKNNNFYYQVSASDFNCEKIKINIWNDDYDIFQEELKEGNLIKILLEPPSGNFSTYSLKKLSWQDRAFNKKRGKLNDFRIVLMRKSENE